VHIIARGFFVYLWTWTGFVREDITTSAFLELKMLCKSSRKKKKKKIEKLKKDLDNEDAIEQRNSVVHTAIYTRFDQLEKDWASLDETSTVNSKAGRILLILGLGSLLLYVPTFVVLVLEFSAVTFICPLGYC
jgi:hypothetical protein